MRISSLGDFRLFNKELNGFCNELKKEVVATNQDFSTITDEGNHDSHQAGMYLNNQSIDTRMSVFNLNDMDMEDNRRSIDNSETFLKDITNLTEEKTQQSIRLFKHKRNSLKFNNL